MIELMALVYLINVNDMPVRNKIVSAKELKSAHFFQGPHELKTKPVIQRYGKAPDGFRKAAESIGGEPIDMADIAFRFQVFPKIPLYYLLWEGDEEFEPNLSILFDRSIDYYLEADAVWGIVNLVSDLLVCGM